MLEEYAWNKIVIIARTRLHSDAHTQTRAQTEHVRAYIHTSSTVMYNYAGGKKQVMNLWSKQAP